MKLFFSGAAHEVTGSCHCMEVGEDKFCIDCGMEQGEDIFVKQELPVSPAELDYILVTHAHIDHTGLLPLMYAKGFRGNIYATKATADLCGIMLRDSAHIQMFEAEWRNRKALRSGGEPYVPLYTMEDAYGAIRQLVPCRYGEVIRISDNVRIRFTDIGHLLGSSSIEVFAKEDMLERTVVFSGDIGNKNKPILKEPIPTSKGDYVIMESTYGDRYHGEHPNYEVRLAEIIDRTLGRGGNVVIPAFAVGRTQELLYYLRIIKEKRLVSSYPGFEVYVDSPLAVQATGLFATNVEDCFNDEAKALVAKGVNPIDFPGLKLSVTSDDSKAINGSQEPKVILSASGMCEAGRIRHHLKHNLWKPESTIVFCGYQANGTLGRRLQDGAAEVKIFGESIDIRAEIATIEGVSGHADRDGLFHWVCSFREKPKTVFVVHGEDAVCTAFAEELQRKYEIPANAPYSGSIFDLGKGVFEYEADPELAQKKLVGKRRARTVFGRLISAGSRLAAVIQKNKGLSNKDIAKFTDQINSLCDKWDKH